MRDRSRVRVRAGDAADLDLAAHAVAHLAARPVENNVPLTLLDAGGATRVAVVSSGAHPIGAAVGSPDGRLVLSAMPAAAARALAQACVGRQAVLPGVSGPAEAARAFAGAWEQVSGQAATLAMRQQIFRLDVVEPPRGVPGRARRASRDDLELVLRWSVAFDAETGVGDADVRANAIRRVAGSGVWLWEVAGTSVAMAVRGPVVAGVTRIGHVYTPPECRRRGYAAALVATVSGDALLGEARSCTLFTDEANPTSNRIYQSIGYRAVGPALLYRFGDGGTVDRHDGPETPMFGSLGERNAISAARGSARRGSGGDGGAR